jgi:hypothetical protein
MALASEMLARAFEKMRGPFPHLDDKQLVSQFLALDKELQLLATLRGLNAADKAVTDNRNAILIFSGSQALEVRSYRDATEALRNLFLLERELPDKDIVLVRADTSDEVRLAFKNYFSDANDFINWVEDACATLSGAKQIAAPGKRRNKRAARKKK